jgi:hypothetical protein
MQIFDFTLLISPPENEETALDKLVEVGCTDCTFGVSYEVFEMYFAREAESLDAALETATRDVKQALGSDVLLVLY